MHTHTLRMQAGSGWVSCLGCMDGWDGRMGGWMDVRLFSCVHVCVHNLICGLVLVDIELQALVEQGKPIYCAEGSALQCFYV